MSSLAASRVPSHVPSLAPPRRRSLPRIYWLETRSELLKLLRLPAYVLPTLGFPLFFYLLFGVSFGGGRQAGLVTMSTYLLATYGAFGVITASLFGFGVGIAIERGQGWMLLKRASPLPPAAYFTAKIAMSMLFGAMIAFLLFLMGATLGGVRLPAEVWLSLFATLVLGALPFCALGLAIGSFAGPSSAPAIVNLVNLPMAFCSGLWIPVEALPPFFRALAPWLPAYHFGQLALATMGAARDEAVGMHLLYLVVFSGLCLGAAALGFRLKEDRAYG